MPLIIYNVTVNVDNEIADEWLQWMKEKHIPDVLATGMFIENHILRVLADEDSGGKTFSIQYLCNSMETYEKYALHFAPALQEEVLQRYRDRFVAFRTLLEVIE